MAIFRTKYGSCNFLCKRKPAYDKSDKQYVYYLESRWQTRPTPHADALQIIRSTGYPGEAIVNPVNLSKITTFHFMSVAYSSFYSSQAPLAPSPSWYSNSPDCAFRPPSFLVQSTLELEF